MNVIVSHPACLKHKTGAGHPEAPVRCIAIERALIASGLQRDENFLIARPATDQDILRCHTDQYLDLLKRELAGYHAGVQELSTGDVTICGDSLEAARVSAGATLEAVDAIYSGEASTAFCSVRPPGHHACSNVGMGFCLLNNVAIAARYAQEHYKVKKIVIVDWDVHHGNGTQEIFYQDPSVFYFSTHRSNFYPPGSGYIEETGAGEGKNTTMNFPIDAGPTARMEVIARFAEELPKAMEEFRPELVLISAGFDAHVLDPLGGFNLTDKDFETLTQLVVDVADHYAKGRVISVLEGGYNPSALATSVALHVEALV